MDSNPDSFGERVAGKAAATGDALSERAADAKSKLSDFARTTAGAVDDNRSAAADGLDTAASTLRAKAGVLPGGESVSGMAHAAADRLSTTANYVREHDVNRMMTDVEGLVTRNPGPSLLVAAAFGFLVGRAMTRE
jgi:ElaB/YqjD/DUF883 family membrane-anchored ribosome-binding protein